MTVPCILSKKVKRKILSENYQPVKKAIPFFFDGNFKIVPQSWLRHCDNFLVQQMKVNWGVILVDVACLKVT